MNEYEKKLLLTREEYDCLLKYFGKRKSWARQINYYFDTDDFSMNRQNTTCRIRLKDGTYQGTLKRHTATTERSEEIDIAVRNGIFDNGFTDMGLKLQGYCVTDRCFLLKNTICDVVLDWNDYLGHVDYELEIEYAPGYEKTADIIFQIYLDVLRTDNPGCVFSTQQVLSKSARFFERLIQSGTNAKQMPHKNPNNLKKETDMKHHKNFSKVEIDFKRTCSQCHAAKGNDAVHPLEIIDDDITRLFGSPLAICENCQHWQNSCCDIIEIGCSYSEK